MEDLWHDLTGSLLLIKYHELFKLMVLPDAGRKRVYKLKGFDSQSTTAEDRFLMNLSASDITRVRDNYNGFFFLIEEMIDYADICPEESVMGPLWCGVARFHGYGYWHVTDG